MTRMMHFENIRQDLKYGLRTMRNHPAFSLAVVLTIALGIGANAAMFSVIRAVLLKPLDYRDPDLVVLLTDGATPGRVEDLAATSRSYSEVGSYAGPEDLDLSDVLVALAASFVPARRAAGIDPLAALRLG